MVAMKRIRMNVMLAAVLLAAVFSAGAARGPVRFDPGPTWSSVRVNTCAGSCLQRTSLRLLTGHAAILVGDMAILP